MFVLYYNTVDIFFFLVGVARFKYSRMLHLILDFNSLLLAKHLRLAGVSVF